jgi:DNA repair photolyase
VRWRLVDEEDGQGALFTEDELVERHVGTGEFRGMEFLHVNARRVINEVPAASRMPFRYTINAYRGCSHACTYCAGGDTPILMGDGRTKRLAEVRPGDTVYGTVQRGAYRRYVITPVLDHWSTVKPAYRTTLEDGTELITSADHRFLSDRGWKHVTGAEHGAERRPHLTPNNKLIGTGHFATCPDHGPDYRRGYLCGMIRGDGSLGSYVYDRPRRGLGVVHRFRLALADHEALTRTQTFLEASGVSVTRFRFKEAVDRYRAMDGIRAQSRAAVHAIREIVDWPDDQAQAWRKGFLAGIFDAEGSYSRGILRISNRDLTILQTVAGCLDTFGFDALIEKAPSKGLAGVRVRGGLREHVRFFHTTDPAITRKRSIAGIALKSSAPLGVLSIEPLCVDLPLFDMTTGTGDFIANGVVSHNCFARPTHEWLGLDTGEDFERKIVVKVNAVERVRAEVGSRRWRGHHIAMGTNTDPYQRAEGKYHLTQGIIGVLSEAANPFSILTKGTLVLRDLDLLVEAARRTEVRLNLSIGTLDRDVWRLTEPGTPPPSKRIDVVARLIDAGIPCGVLVAPVLPGLSDDDDQLAEVVEAAVRAGAVSVSAVVLHLRPGVREVFLRRLGETRPDLAAEYERRFAGRAYLPQAEQHLLGERVRALVEAARGRYARPGSIRSLITPSEPTPHVPRPHDATPPTTQLTLGL